MMSDGTKPLLNLPVGVFPEAKSRPYGKKSHLMKVAGMWLLFPESTMESPNTITAGTVSLCATSTKEEEEEAFC